MIPNHPTVEPATRALMERVMKQASRLFQESRGRKMLLPCWMLDDGRQVVVVGTPFENPDEKEVVDQAMRRTMALRQVVRYAFVCETWLKEYDRDDPEAARVRAERPNLEKEAGRVEAIMVRGADRSSGCEALLHREITRTADGSGSLGEAKWWFPVMEEGRFANMLVPERKQ